MEVKSVQEVAPVHHAQLLTYLKLTGYAVGLLINFNVPVLKDGISRRVNKLAPESSSPNDGQVLPAGRTPAFDA